MSVQLPKPTPIAADCPIDLEIDSLLTMLAKQALRGDLRSRDALHDLLSPKMERSTRAVAARFGFFQGRVIETDDLVQETHLLFYTLLAEWSGEGLFGEYFFAALPWRIRHEARRLVRQGRLPQSELRGPDRVVAQPVSRSEIIERIRSQVTPFERDLLDSKIELGWTHAQFAKHRNLSLSTVRRHWKRVRAKAISEFQIQNLACYHPDTKSCSSEGVDNDVKRDHPADHHQRNLA